MHSSGFAGRVVAHPNGGSIREQFKSPPCHGGSCRVVSVHGPQEPGLTWQGAIEDHADGRTASLGSWRPIGAVVAAVVAGLGHGVKASTPAS